MFRTASLDLGVYTNALFDYGHLRPNDCTLLPNQNATPENVRISNKWSDHFSITQVLYTPFQFLFGSYTLLLIQITSILFGGWGVYRFFVERNSNYILATLAMVHFYWVFGIHSALAFDYHDNVIGSMLVPWLFVFLIKEKWWQFSLLALAILGCKETMSILLISIFGVLTLFPLVKNKQQRVATGILALASITYFIIVTKWAMPNLADNGQTYSHFKYSALGNSYGEAIKFAISHPWQTTKMFFVNHTGSQFGNGIKTELYIILLLSGGFVWLRKPKWLLMALPIIALKVLNDELGKWGINYHYSIEFAPILTFPLFMWIGEKSFNQKIKVLAFGVMFLAMGTTVVKYVGRTAKWYDPYRQNPFSFTHYKRNFKVNELHATIKKHIPKDEKTIVSAHYSIVPHIAYRETLYEFPNVLNADYIISILPTRDDEVYPMQSIEAYKNELEAYATSPNWEVLYRENESIVLKRKKAN